MSLLIDSFAYLSVVLQGAGFVLLALAVGGIGFALWVAPAASARWRLGVALAALATAAVESAALGLNLAVLVQSADIDLGSALGARFVWVAALKIGALLALAGLAFTRAGPRSLAAPALLALAATAATSHADARVDGRLPLAALTWAHATAASLWIGGLPYLIAALARAGDPHPETARRIALRFSRLAMTCVAVLSAAAVGLSVCYLGSLDGIWGTAYGVMLATKFALLALLLGLGALNFRGVRGLARDPAASLARLRALAAAETGIGIAVFLATASLVSQPPSVDQVQDRMSAREIWERVAPHAPRLSSPEHASLSIPALQQRLDAEAAQRGEVAAQAYVPGSGEMPPSTAEDVAWSEYNHNWAGLLLLAIGLLAIAHRSGRAPWARHWPLGLLALALFVLVRSDPEAWPLGSISFLASLRDPEVAQHRFFVALTAGFALFEWRVRTGRWTGARASSVFPLGCAIGGSLLLTHSHGLETSSQQLLTELPHNGIALLGIAAGWARWLELRLPARDRAVASWIWPPCLALAGCILLFYRES